MATDIDSLLAQAAAGGGGAGPSTGPLLPVRYPGKKYDSKGAGSVNALEYGLADPHGKSSLMDVDSASNAIYGWSEDDQRAFAKKAWYLGGLASPDDLGGAFNLWDQAVKQASRFAAAGNPMDPQDVLEMMLSGDPDAQKARARRKDGGVVTQKSSAINLSDPSEVRLLIEEAFKAKMGRGPTDAEVNTLVSSLHAQQRANPTTTTQTSKYDDAGNLVSQDSQSAGGVNPGGFVSGEVDVNPEAAEYQAAGPMFNALLRALGPASGTLGR